MYCDHKKQIGDHYGISCQDCGYVLKGYGYGGFFRSNLKGNEACMHESRYKSNDIEEECMYCHAIRERKNKTH
jgi:hypothetical protein